MKMQIKIKIKINDEIQRSPSAHHIDCNSANIKTSNTINSIESKRDSLRGSKRVPNEEGGREGERGRESERERE